MTHKIQKEKNSKVEIEVTVPNNDFKTYWDKGFKSLQKEIEMDGFRKGNAPEAAILAKYGEMAILQEMANICINDTYAKIVIEEKIKIISEPHIHIVKLSSADDFVYHAHVEVFPEFSLPDYKQIAKEALKDKKEILETTQEEVDNILNNLDEVVKKETPDLEKMIKENLKSEKEFYEDQRIRSKILEDLVKEVEKENKDCFPEKFEDKDKAQAIVFNIAEKEGIKASEEELDAEIVKIMSQISQSEKSNIDDLRLKSYANQLIVNEKVLNLLEVK